LSFGCNAPQELLNYKFLGAGNTVARQQFASAQRCSRKENGGMREQTIWLEDYF
jgi:hypothetical protein